MGYPARTSPTFCAEGDLLDQCVELVRRQQGLVVVLAPVDRQPGTGHLHEELDRAVVTQTYSPKHFSWSTWISLTSRVMNLMFLCFSSSMMRCGET